jgi:hypothetical protein
MAMGGGPSGVLLGLVRQEPIEKALSLLTAAAGFDADASSQLGDGVSEAAG